jgi:proteasome lid subunit RPN8/RPN11
MPNFEYRGLMREPSALMFSRALHDRLLRAVLDRHPRKSFGYLVSDGSLFQPVDFVLFEGNDRNVGPWQQEFWRRGRYFVDHEDAGFVATPEESWKVQKLLAVRGLFEIGVFHTHQRHPANFSSIDYDMHVRRFDNLWHLVISLRNVALPQVRAFAVSHYGVREIEVHFMDENGTGDIERGPSARRS